ncbi:hypothetical protein [Ancylobacter sp.]|uniref:hypothetical protein n=1 Tax=Ancylobacter sp. TaxID=1872567 RepID=UPI003D0D6642
MARQGKVLKSFPYAVDGVNIENLAVDREYPIADAHFAGLRDAGYIASGKDDDAEVAEKVDLDRRIVAAFDRKLAVVSDEELKSIIARSGTPWSGNLVHAELVAAAKAQLVREMEGAEPIMGIDPASGVTEQPLSAPGAPTPPSAPAAAQTDQVGGASGNTSHAAPTDLKAVHRGGGSYSVLDAAGNEVAEKLSKADAEAFNAFNAADKADFVTTRAKKG